MGLPRVVTSTVSPEANRTPSVAVWRCRGAATRGSRAPATVETAILEGLGAVLGGDGLDVGKVGDRARDADDAVVTPRREPQARHRGGEEPLGVGGDRTEPAEQPAADLRVEPCARGAASRVLAGAGPRHPRADGGRVVADRRARVLLPLERRQLDVQVDAIEQRSRHPPEIPIALAGCAQASVQGRTAAATRIRGGDELEARGKVADTAGARDGDTPVLERLAQRLEHVLLELRQP